MLPKIVLASQSPRRQELLTLAGVDFEIRVSSIAEERGPEESPRDYVRRLAREKATAVARAGEMVLGADTIVVLGNTVLEKPGDAEHARSMLSALSGHEHVVMTGVCLLHRGGAIEEIEETKVRFTSITPHEIDDYVASGEPMDKAGAYAIQGGASKFIERIDGCYFNVMGLPVSRVYRMLKSAIES